MQRFSFLTVALICFCCGLGCGGSTEKDKNPNPSLGEINTKELPKRDGVKDSKKK